MFLYIKAAVELRTCRLRRLSVSVCTRVHTLWELGRVVVDICQGDVDGCGAREASDLACHVFGLNHNSVVFSGFTVHVG